MARAAALLVVAVAMVLPTGSVHERALRAAASLTAEDFVPANEAALELLRERGDLVGQRRHLWQVLANITEPSGRLGLARFMTWFGAAETFAERPAAPAALRTAAMPFAIDERSALRGSLSNQPPLIVLAHYNDAAYRHIRTNSLHRQSALAALQAPLTTPAGSGSANAIPAFPRAAIVLKSAWWPVPAEGAVAMPVWDALANPAHRSGNDYPTWKRVVAVCNRASGAVDVALLGRTMRLQQCIGIERFFNLVLDAEFAALLMQEPTARKLANMVIGRPLRAGDRLALVALHVTTREIADWVWGTLWWHDRADSGPHAAGRPVAQAAPWRSYVLDVAFDADRPREPDGSARIVFNPWLEARFADSGHGGGTVSNCVSCHTRAASPALDPFRVTRGAEPPTVGAGSGSSVSTSSLWSIPLQAR